jgi:hypothetical protein
VSSERVPLNHSPAASVAPNSKRIQLTLADCSRMDELANLAELVEELLSHYKRAQDADNEIRLSRILAHVERRLGQVLKAAAANAERARSRGATSALTLSVLGIPRDRVSRAMQLADLPEPEIESAPAQHCASAGESYSQPWSFEEFMRDE